MPPPIVKFNSQPGMANPERVEMFDPRNPGRVVVVENASRHDQALSNTEIGALRMADSKVTWRVGMEETRDVGFEPLEDFIIRDAFGVEYVISKIARSETMRFYDMTANAPPDRRAL